MASSAARSSLLRTKAWIGGQWRAALSENTFPVYNPANNELIAEVWSHGNYLPSIDISSRATSRRARGDNLRVYLHHAGSRHGSRWRGCCSPRRLCKPEAMGYTHGQGIHCADCALLYNFSDSGNYVTLRAMEPLYCKHHWDGQNCPRQWGVLIAVSWIRTSPY